MPSSQVMASIGRAAVNTGRIAIRNAAQREAAYVAGEIGLVEAATGGSPAAFLVEAGVTIAVVEMLANSSEKNGTIEDEIVQGAITGAVIGAVKGALTGGVGGAVTGAIVGGIEGAAEGAAVGIYKEGGVKFGDSEDQTSSAQQSQPSATDLERVSTPESSFISEIAYSKSQSQLQVTMKAGGSYTYENVPQGTWDSFKAASSKGQFFDSNIKGVYGA